MAGIPFYFGRVSLIQHRFNLSFGVERELVRQERSHYWGTKHTERGRYYNDWLGDFITTDEYDVTEPISELHYPIFDEAYSQVSVSSLPTSMEHMKGFVWAAFHWRNFFIDILPPGISGLDLVVSNSCNHSFTYRLKGPDVEFLGFGDHHEMRFNDLEVSSTLAQLDEYQTGTNSYTGIPLDEALCKYQFHIYPSKVFEERYVTANPWAYTFSAVAIFIFTSAVFWVYDFVVERRQRKVMLAGK